AVGKKNWLFVGDPNAGQRSAVLYSIILTCQHLGIQPLDYLRDVFTRLPQISSNKENIIPLLPHNWKASSITV
ncbi:transposase domain-containing protein, partial [Arthrospira platensis SPKY2]